MTVLLLSCSTAPVWWPRPPASSTNVGDIAHADQHADDRHGLFLQRIEFSFADDADHERFRAEFASLAPSRSA